jgi:acetyltransferase-like isoleucine patch superfamily enzyme
VRHASERTVTVADSALARTRWAAAVARSPALRAQPLMWLGARARVQLGPAAQLHVAPGFVAEADLSLTVSGRLQVGARFYANRWFNLVAHADVLLGDDVLVGERVSIHDEDHTFEPVGASRASFTTAPIVIGDRVFLGAGTVVLKGVTIGADTVVGAGSVVSRDLPAGVLAAGAPARVVRSLAG